MEYKPTSKQFMATTEQGYYLGYRSKGFATDVTPGYMDNVLDPPRRIFDEDEADEVLIAATKRIDDLAAEWSSIVPSPLDETLLKSIQLRAIAHKIGVLNVVVNVLGEHISTAAATQEALEHTIDGSI